MAAEKISGKLASATFVKKTDKGWSNYDLVFDNGTSYQGVGVPPDNKTKIEPGETLTLFKTRFSWMVGNEGDGESRSNENSSKNGSSSNSGKSEYKSDFKQSKDEWNQYQITERDPKIERQTYIRMAVDFYSACIPFMEKQPKDSREIDALFDDAVAKGDAEYQRASK